MDAKDVAGELAALQRNRGLQTADLAVHVGPLLTGLTGFGPARGLEARESLTRQLFRAAQALPPDLRVVFVRACGHNLGDASTLQARLVTAGSVIDRSLRVVRRRLDDANLLVAERLLEAAANDRGWILAELRSHVDFRHERPTYTADRLLVVTAQTLTHVKEMISLPGAGPSVEPEFAALSGAILDEARRIQEQTWEFTLKLDRPYRCGELIHYRSALRIPHRRDAPPMSVIAPRRDCWYFSTTVHLGGFAESAWIIDGAPPLAVNEDQPPGVPTTVSGSSEATAEFRHLTPGLVYGLRWRWNDPTET